jgi:hypothetical protein
LGLLQARIGLIAPIDASGWSGTLWRFGRGLLQQPGDGVLVDLPGHGDAADPVDLADARVEDPGAVGQEGVGGALDTPALAFLPVRDHAAAVTAAVEGVQEALLVQARLGRDVGQGRPERQVAAVEEEGPAGGLVEAVGRLWPATFRASIAGRKVEGQVARLGGEKWSGSSWASTGTSWLRVSHGVPRWLTSSSGQHRQATGGRPTATLARRTRMENT